VCLQSSMGLDTCIAVLHLAIESYVFVAAPSVGQRSDLPLEVLSWILEASSKLLSILPSDSCLQTRSSVCGSTI
jgi:hypothetical protein